MSTEAVLIQQHLIDPEICIRCNTCEATCPVGAITHDSRNYVVDADKCNLCMACVPPCPTGSIDNWRTMPRTRAYSVNEQLGWDELPANLSDDEIAAFTGEPAPAPNDVQLAAQATAASVSSNSAPTAAPAAIGSTLPPWSAAHAYTNLYGPKAAQKNHQGHGGRQRSRDRGGQGLRHPPHRARFWCHAVPGA